MELSPLGTHWFVAQTDPRQEVTAFRSIDDAGIIAYLPMMHAPEPHGRNGSRFATRPIFPGYLFTRCLPTDLAWNTVARAKGVHHILGGPTPVDDQAIEVVQCFEAENLERHTKVLRSKSKGYSGMEWRFAPGQRVLIRSGPFAGFYADLQQSVDKQDRVLALISLFNAKSRVELSAFDLEEPSALT
jgi:transcription antitermination factor NusG